MGIGTWFLVSFCPPVQDKPANLLFALHAIVLFMGWPSQIALIASNLSQDSKKERKWRIGSWVGSSSR
jgi:hypothetical protein